MAITREMIWSAATELDAAGDKPTLAAIRKRVGGGSYTTISESMTAWHAGRAELVPSPDPVPERLGSETTQFVSVVWKLAQELAEARLKVDRTSLEEAGARLQSEKAEAAAFADQLNQELDALKVQLAELRQAADAGQAKIATLQAAHDQEAARADRLEAVANERDRTIETLGHELQQVRKDKEAEIERLLSIKKARPNS